MTLIVAEAFKCVLCMDIDQYALRIAAVEKDTGRIVHSEIFNLDAYDKSSVRKILENSIFKTEFSGYCLTVGNSRNTIIPVDIFNHTKAEEVFALTFPAPYNDVDYTRIPELGIVNIAEIPLWIKSSFIIKIPRTKIVHRSTSFLKGIFAGDTFREQIHLCINKDSFMLALIEKGKLQFYNQFDFTAVSDIIYHTIYLIDQQKLDNQQLKIHLYGVSAKWSEMEEFVSYFKATIVCNDAAAESEQFVLKNQISCV